MSQQEGKPENMQLSDYLGNITVIDFLLKHGEDDSNASNESFNFDNLFYKKGHNLYTFLD